MTLDEIRDKFTTEATNLYVVINSDGHYFRRKGYGGYGDTWVASMNTARVYAKLSQARSVVTFFANSYPQYPTPKIVRLQVTPWKSWTKASAWPDATLSDRKQKHAVTLGPKNNN